MPFCSIKIGKEIEDLVSSYLQQRGLKLVEVNYRCKVGEIDLIMNDNEILVFVEVRYRKDSDYGGGLATVTKYKQNKIKRAATLYLLENNIYDKVPCRFDVVAVSGRLHKKINWVKDAFWIKW